MTRYLIGFVLSLLVTFGTFGIVELHLLNHHRWPTHGEIIPAIFILALAQILIQLVCFLHIDFKKESRERLVVLGGAFLVVCILLSGSLWIMLTLRGRMMPDTQRMEQYMHAQIGF